MNEDIKDIKKEIDAINNGVKLICGYCKYIWNYNGKNPFYATCPRCLRKVNTTTRRYDLIKRTEEFFGETKK